MKFIKILMFMVCVLVYGNVLTALEVGDDAPPLDIARWIKGPPVTLFPKSNADTKAYVIFFWSTWSNVSPNLMNFISRESYIFAKDGVVFAGITKESPNRVTRFLKKFPDINFSIGIDNQAGSYSAYMQGTKGVPMFFIIGSDKKLIWKGSPFEANRVLVRVLGGTFDLETQEQIVKYREKIQKAAQMLDNKDKIFYARKILKLDPTDRMAMNIIIDSYIIKGKEKRAINFICSSRKKAAGNRYIQRELFFLELSIVRSMNNSTGKKYLAELMSSYNTVFGKDSNALNSLLIIVLRDVPLSIIPLGDMLIISQKAVKLAEANNQDKENLGSCLQSLAKVYYYIGQLDKAVSKQEKAIGFMDKVKKDEKEAAQLMVTYYKEALKLNQQSKTSN